MVGLAGFGWVSRQRSVGPAERGFVFSVFFCPRSDRIALRLWTPKRQSAGIVFGKSPPLGLVLGRHWTSVKRPRLAADQFLPVSLLLLRHWTSVVRPGRLAVYQYPRVSLALLRYWTSVAQST